jgi:4-hydroxy-tetrahydrodipicolinate synthase
MLIYLPFELYKLHFVKGYTMLDATIFKGFFTALITPFRDDHSVDYDAFARLVEWQIQSGIHGLVPCGTTGESPTLTNEEQKKLIALCVEVSNGRVPVIAGTGSNNTSKSVDMTRYAASIGADAALIVAPYYNKPTQQGLIAHYTAIADASEIPVFIYNIPGRSVVNISQDSLKALAAHPMIIGVKDATAALDRPTLTRIQCGPDFRQLSGEDASICGFLAQGGHGAISVTSNLMPAECAALYNAWNTQDLKTVTELRDKMALLHDALFSEPSPAPVKYMLSKLGLCANVLRLPMLPASEAITNNLHIVFEGLNLKSMNKEELDALMPKNEGQQERQTA